MQQPPGYAPAIRLGAVTLVVLLGLTAAATLTRGDRGPGAADQRPNVVVVMTDDMRFDDLAAMPYTRGLFAEQGARFSRAYDEFPLCCPARAAFLTGQYAHNHGVRSNRGPAVARFMDRMPDDLLPEWLRDRGYATGMVGKYFNRYGRRDRGAVPPGWDFWRVLTYPRGAPGYYGFTLDEDGRRRRYPRSRRGYLTTVLTRHAVDFIDARRRAGAPFFLWASYFAPHNGSGPDPYNSREGYCARGPVPPPGGLAAHLEDPLPGRGGYDEDTSDKPPSVRRAPLTRGERAAILRRHRCRRASLAAVDRGVRKMVRALGPKRDETLLVFLSDNGYLQGEHRLPVGKLEVYEESSRLPLMLRGPGVGQGAVSTTVASNIDVAPTILDATGAEAGRELDGRSLLDVLAGTAAPRAGVLIRSASYAAVHTGRWVWAHRGGPRERELYDLKADPFQLNNLWDVRRGRAKPGHASRAEDLEALRARLRDCQGQEDCS